MGERPKSPADRLKSLNDKMTTPSFQNDLRNMIIAKSLELKSRRFCFSPVYVVPSASRRDGVLYALMI